MKAVFLDRDGTIIRDEGYLRDPARVSLLPHAVKGLRLMRELGYGLFLVTNQSGVARGLMTEEDAAAVNAELLRLLAEQGADIDDVRVCPHLDAGCFCRKPQPGMLLDLAAAHGIDLRRSVMIGDKESDVEAGRAAGCSASLLVGAGGWNDLLIIARWLHTKEVRR